MRTLKLVIEYDGTRYAGWQRQENALTVQAEVERALATILREPITVHGAGRTDAGVHARGQVASFTTTSDRDPFALVGGLNGLLPNDIVVHSAEDVPESFHARFSATGRRYTYTITTAPSALLRHCSWYLRYKMDPLILDEAAAMLQGEHDFESFCRVHADVEHHRCTVDDARWRREGTLLVFDIRADRFVHGMVRALVGTMVDVARGYNTLEHFRALFETGDRAAAGPAAPPRGLVLEEVTYHKL